MVNSQRNSPVAENILKPKMQPTDLSENKNLAQGIKINICQHPVSSAFKLVSSQSITSQNN
jgi:capsid protein